MTAEITPPRILPREEIKPAWSRGCLAWPVAYAAFREVLPEMPEAQAKMETTYAIAYATANHTTWFWGGAYGEG